MYLSTKSRPVAESFPLTTSSYPLQAGPIPSNLADRRTASWLPPLPKVSKQLAGTRDGLQTPPPDIMAAQVDSLRLSSVPQSKAEIYPAKLQNARGMEPPLYLPDLSFAGPLVQLPATQLKPTSQPQSPILPGIPGTASRSHHPRKSSTSSEIATSMQIPASINNSQGSLAEFTAQITNLFWFESSKTLQWIEDSNTIPAAVGPVVADAIPTAGFRKWVTTILATTRVTQNVVLLALMFVYRLKTMNPSVKGKPGSEYRLLTVALMLGNKFLDDNTYTNKTWAEVSGISVKEIHIMEVEFLSNMRYSLFTSEREWRDWQSKLSKFWEYFNNASKYVAERSPPRNAHGSSGLLLVPPLPSPPASTRASPPFLSSCSPTNVGYSHPLSMPPQLTNSSNSPTDPISEYDQTMRARKRSYDDGALEPPAKRISRAMAPLPSGGAMQARPNFNGHHLQNAPQLPAPNNTVMPAMQHQNAPASQNFAHLPPPCGRAMSSVYSGVSPGNWSQNSTTPSIASGPLTPSFSISPFTDQSRKSSPYTITPSTTSPTSASFPAPAGPHAHSSPSYFLNSRSSPYRPVRKVSTLLGQPPPSMEPNVLPLEMGSMHYHPLGRPRYECKTGVVPVLHLENWQQAQQPLHQMWPSGTAPRT